jgi:signal transduction histidine kinase
MRDRIKALWATFEVASTAARGTTIGNSIPNEAV